MISLLAMGPAMSSDVAFGLELLARSLPLWPMDADEWERAVAAVRAFAERWDRPARAAGWSDLELYSLHPCAPYRRLTAMGAAWSTARSGWHAIAVDAGAITLATRAGARLRYYRTATIDPEAVLAWDLVCGPTDAHHGRGIGRVQWTQPRRSLQTAS